MNCEKEFLKLKAEIAEIKRKLDMVESANKAYPTKRFYLCRLVKNIYGDRWGSWEENKFVPIYHLVDDKQCTIGFDTIEEAAEYGKNNNWGERIYIKDSKTNKVVRPKNVKIKRTCDNCDLNKECEFKRKCFGVCNNWKNSCTT